MERKKERTRCQYSRKKCYTDATASSNFCELHEENLSKCCYTCPSTHIQCNSAVSDNCNNFCETHKRFLDRNRKRYHAFEQKYSMKLPAHKREIEVDFVEEKFNNYLDHARYVDLLSRPAAPYPISNAGIYSLDEIENIKLAVNDVLQNRLQETRKLYQQRAHSAAFALDEELKERTNKEEKFTIVTNSSAETAIALQALIEDSKKKIAELPIPDKNDLTHPAQRKNYQNHAETQSNQKDDYCQYSEIRRNVPASFTFDNNKKDISVDEAVRETINFILESLDDNIDQIAYIHERLCTSKKLQGFNHCFKHLWKEAPALKKCIECKSTCTLASNICGKCLKPFIDVKTENMVCLSDDEEEEECFATVSIGAADNDLNAILTECSQKLKESVKEKDDPDLEIASPHKFDTKNLAEEKRLEFMWRDMLKFGLECENVSFSKEIIANDIPLPSSIPFEYNNVYDVEKMISTTSGDEASDPEPKRICFSQEDGRKPMVFRFPSRTLSEKAIAHVDKSPEIAIGVDDPSQLPVQFRHVPPPPPPAVVNPPHTQPTRVSSQTQQPRVPSQNQPTRLQRTTYYSPSTTNTFRLIRDVNPAARSSHQYMYPSGSRQITSNVFVQTPRIVSPYARPVRLLRPQQNVKYVYQTVPATYESAYPTVTYSYPSVSYVSANPSVSYVSADPSVSYVSANASSSYPSSNSSVSYVSTNPSVSYVSANPPLQYTQSHEVPPVTYVYYTRAPGGQYRRFLP